MAFKDMAKQATLAKAVPVKKGKRNPKKSGFLSLG